MGERSGEIRRRARKPERLDDEQRREARQQRGVARDRNVAALERIGDALVGRFFRLGFAVRRLPPRLSISFEIRPLRYRRLSAVRFRRAAPSRAPAGRSALRALSISAAGAEVGLASSPSTSRRERDAIADSTGSRKSASVPRSARTTTSVESLSNSSARARWLRRARSLNENSMVRTTCASCGLEAASAFMTSSASLASRLLMISAMRARLSSPCEAAAPPSSASRKASSMSASAPSPMVGGASSWTSTSLRISRGNCATMRAESEASSLERM